MSFAIKIRANISEKRIKFTGHILFAVDVSIPLQ